MCYCMPGGEAVEGESNMSFRGESLLTCMESTVALSLWLTPLDIKMYFTCKVSGTFTYLGV
jgi:hypothetical protein